MYGLIIPEPRLGYLLDGYVQYERRPFSTQKRGRVALVDSDSKCVRGFADLRSVEKISYAEYREQHGSQITGDMWAMHRTYYEFRFARVRKLRRPLHIALGEETVWVELPDSLEKGSTQRSLMEY